MKYIYSTSQMLKLSLTSCTFSITGSVAGLFLTKYEREDVLKLQTMNFIFIFHFHFYFYFTFYLKLGFSMMLWSQLSQINHTTML